MKKNFHTLIILCLAIFCAACSTEDYEAQTTPIKITDRFTATTDIPDSLKGKTRVCLSDRVTSAFGSGYIRYWEEGDEVLVFCTKDMIEVKDDYFHFNWKKGSYKTFTYKLLAGAGAREGIFGGDNEGMEKLCALYCPMGSNFTLEPHPGDPDYSGYYPLRPTIIFDTKSEFTDGVDNKLTLIAPFITRRSDAELTQDNTFSQAIAPLIKLSVENIPEGYCHAALRVADDDPYIAGRSSIDFQFFSGAHRYEVMQEDNPTGKRELTLNFDHAPNKDLHFPFPKGQYKELTALLYNDKGDTITLETYHDVSILDGVNVDELEIDPTLYRTETFVSTTAEATEAFQNSYSVTLTNITDAETAPAIQMPAVSRSANILTLQDVSTQKPVTITQLYDSDNAGAKNVYLCLPEKTTAPADITINAQHSRLHISTLGRVATANSRQATRAEDETESATIEHLTVYGEGDVEIAAGVTVNHLHVKGGNVLVRGKVLDVDRTADNHSESTELKRYDRSASYPLDISDPKIFYLKSVRYEQECAIDDEPKWGWRTMVAVHRKSTYSNGKSQTEIITPPYWELQSGAIVPWRRGDYTSSIEPCDATTEYYIEQGTLQKGYSENFNTEYYFKLRRRIDNGNSGFEEGYAEIGLDNLDYLKITDENYYDPDRDFNLSQWKEAWKKRLQYKQPTFPVGQDKNLPLPAEENTQGFMTTERPNGFYIFTEFHMYPDLPRYISGSYEAPPELNATMENFWPISGGFSFEIHYFVIDNKVIFFPNDWLPKADPFLFEEIPAKQVSKMRPGGRARTFHTHHSVTFMGQPFYYDNVVTFYERRQ